jgi:hypothetical protein
VKAAAILADDLPDGDMFTGRTHPGMISYEFLRSHGVTISAAKAMPLQLPAGVRLLRRGKTRKPAWWARPVSSRSASVRHTKSARAAWRTASRAAS